jgi:putative tricarboxylic transport membrane protein
LVQSWLFETKQEKFFSKEKPMEKSDRTSALFFIGLSLFVCQQSATIGLGTLRKPGPGLLAFGTGVGIGLLSLGLLIQSFTSRGKESGIGHGEKMIPRVKFLLICVSLFAYIIIMNWLGFVLSTFLFVLFLLYTIELERWWRRILKAVLITVGNYFIFVVWLGLSLPKGFWAW